MDAVRSFLFEADDIALDFLNTRRIERRRVVEVLTGPEALRSWLEEAGLSGAAESVAASSPPEVRLLLTEARTLRDEIGSAVVARSSGAPLPSTSLYAINRVLAASDPELSLVQEEDALELIEVERGRHVLTPLIPVAIAAAELLAGADPVRIRQCASDTCVLWFLDTSKNGRRRWCSMARCGNRAKAARHYRKQKRAN